MGRRILEQPDNVALVGGGQALQVKVMDFGIAKVLEALSSTKGSAEGDGDQHPVCSQLRYLWLFDNPIAEPQRALERLQSALGDKCEICGLK